MQPEFILLAIGLGLTVLAGVVVVASMRRGTVPSKAETLTASTPPFPVPLAGRADRAIVPPEKLILRGLQELLDRDPSDAFVIFEHPSTKRFVQFMRTDAGVMLEFPLIDLTEAERGRARALFAAHSLPVSPIAGSAGSMEKYQADFGGDIGRAAEFAVEIFRRVFELGGEFPLYVKTE